MVRVKGNKVESCSNFQIENYIFIMATLKLFVWISKEEHLIVINKDLQIIFVYVCTLEKPRNRFSKIQNCLSQCCNVVASMKLNSFIKFPILPKKIKIVTEWMDVMSNYNLCQLLGLDDVYASLKHWLGKRWKSGAQCLKKEQLHTFFYTIMSKTKI